MSYRALPPPRPHRRPGQPADPRRHDVRRLGQPRPRRVDLDHPPRARRRHQRHRHRRRLRPRRVRGDRRQGAPGPQGQPRRRLPGHQVPRQHARRGPQPGRQLASLDRPRGRGSRCAGCRPTTSTSTRCTARAPRSTSTRPSAPSPTSSGRGRSATSGPRPSCRRRSWRPSGSRRSASASARSPSSRRTRSSPARWSATSCRPPRSTASAYCRGARSRVAGSRAATAVARTRRSTSSRLRRQPARHDPSAPENRVKLEAVHQLQELADEAGLSLIHLALGFVLAHPGGDLGHHRPAHPGAARVPAGRGEGEPVRRRAGPDRRDRPARHDAQRGRPRLRTAGPRGGGAAASVIRSDPAGGPRRSDHAQRTDRDRQPVDHGERVEVGALGAGEGDAADRQGQRGAEGVGDLQGRGVEAAVGVGRWRRASPRWCVGRRSPSRRWRGRTPPPARPRAGPHPRGAATLSSAMPDTPASTTRRADAQGAARATPARRAVRDLARRRPHHADARQRDAGPAGREAPVLLQDVDDVGLGAEEGCAAGGRGWRSPTAGRGAGPVRRAGAGGRARRSRART